MAESGAVEFRGKEFFSTAEDGAKPKKKAGNFAAMGLSRGAPSPAPHTTTAQRQVCRTS